jgi:hypothetical protein
MRSTFSSDFLSTDIYFSFPIFLPFFDSVGRWLCIFQAFVSALFKQYDNYLGVYTTPNCGFK